MKSSMTKLIFTTLLLVFAWMDGEAQGWRRTYTLVPDSVHLQDWTRMVFQMSDDGYLMIGDGIIRTDAEGDTIWTRKFNIFQINYYDGNNMAAVLPDESFVVAGRGASEDSIYFAKYSPLGDLVWLRSYSFNQQFDANGVSMTADGGFAILITTFSATQGTKIAMLKTDANGNEEWRQIISGNGIELGRSIISLSDGGFAIAGQKILNQQWKPYVIKMAANGFVEWADLYDVPHTGYAASLIESSDHYLMVTGTQTPLPSGGNSSVYVKKLDLDGNESWTVNNGTNDLNEPGDIIETNDGHFVICGELLPDLDAGGNRQGFLWKINEDGEEIWLRVFDQDYQQYEYFKSVEQTSDGGFIIGGSQFGNSPLDFDMVLVKTDALGYDYSHHLTGNLFRDDDLGCDLDPGELGLDGWLITATDGQQVFYGNTDADGNYRILLDTGTYEVSVTPYLYWENCQPSYTVQALQTYDTTILAIPLKPEYLCPYMQVDMAHLVQLTLCNENSYSISYCNLGTVEAVGATVQVTLDENLSYISATVPLLSQQGQLLTFDIGTVGIGDCGAFRLDFSTSCNPEIFNSTLCSEAHIFPDSICIEDYWLGPNLRIQAGCEGDSVVFNIINEGGNMTEPAQYIVIEDNLIMMTNDFQLPTGGESEVRVAAQNESTYHLVASQSPGFPGVLGYPVATASAEGCSGSLNPGAFLQLTPDDGEPWLDISCATISDFNYPSVAMIATPTGWQDEHFITNNTVIQYRIQFQNTSAGTVQDVVIVDSIPATLDPATIVLGASSHPFSFELLGQGTAKFTFNDVQLPDSISNEPGSHGFVEFEITQTPDNQPGTLIVNQALVQLDYGNPVATNHVFHTIQAQWLSLFNNAGEEFKEAIKVKIFPNPMSDWAIIEVAKLPSAPKGEHENTLTIFDAMGHQVLRQRFIQNKALLQRSGLVAGLYFFKIENGGQQVAAGKMVVR